jgi:hypothetical protein
MTRPVILIVASNSITPPGPRHSTIVSPSQPVQVSAKTMQLPGSEYNTGSRADDALVTTATIRRAPATDDPSGDSHDTFFQIVPKPRTYDRSPFYNMLNNEDLYRSAPFRLPRSFVIRIEPRAIRRANANGLRYGCGEAFQSNSFGYTGQNSGGAHTSANVRGASLDVPLWSGFGVMTHCTGARRKSAITNIFPVGTGAQFG